MRWTDTELGEAVRAVGCGGEPFSSAQVRAHLGITTEDRRLQTRFNAALRAYSRERLGSLARLGKNRYRLLESDVPEDEEVRPRLPRRVVIRIIRTPAAPEPKAARSWLSSLLAWLLRPVLRLARG